MDAVMLALYAVAAGAVLGVAGLRWWQGVQADAEAMTGASPQMPPPMPPGPEAAPEEQPTTEPPSPWQAMPGGRLELGVSGFYIQAHFSPSSHPYYALTSPEHIGLGWSVHLAVLKTLGERLAAERDEFHALPARADAAQVIAAAKRHGAT